MGYTNDWYEENKDKVLKKRKSRYHSDPEYREKVKAAARERSKKVRREQREAAYKLDLNGKTIKCTPIKALAAELGITPKRIAYFQKQGYIPAALVLRPTRAYTPSQVTLITKLDKFLSENNTDLRRPNSPEGKIAHRQLSGITQTIHENWNQ